MPRRTPNGNTSGGFTGNARGRGGFNPNARGGGYAGNDRRFAPRPGASPEGQGAYGRPSRWDRTNRPPPRDARPQQSAPAARRNDPPAATGDGPSIDRFELFCAYHLGITAEGGYRIQNLHEVARRFGTNAAALKQTLTACGMDADDMVHSTFDLASAQIDIMVAPEGVSRKELARPLYDEFLESPRKARNWAKEMEEAERAIEGTLGRDGRWSPGKRDPAGKQS